MCPDEYLFVKQMYSTYFRLITVTQVSSLSLANLWSQEIFFPDNLIWDFFYINMGKVFLRSQLLSKNFIAHSPILFFLYASAPLVRWSHMNIVFNTNTPLQLKRFYQDPTTQDAVHKQTQLDFHHQTGSRAHCQNSKSPNNIMVLCVLKQKNMTGNSLPLW